VRSAIEQTSSLLLHRYILICRSWAFVSRDQIGGEKGYGPAVSNHANSFGFRLSVELGALQEVLLAANALGVAESCFG
jgi:hypothetical protein